MTEPAGEAVLVERRRVTPRLLVGAVRRPLDYLLAVGLNRDIVQLTAPGKQFFLIVNPALVEQLLAIDYGRLKRRLLAQVLHFTGESLISHEGERHARHRSLVEPSFREDAIAPYAAIVTDCIAREEAGWSDGATIDIDRSLTDVALDVIGFGLFDGDYREQSAKVRAAFDASREVFSRNLMPGSAVLWMLPLPATRRYNGARARLAKAIDGMAATRRETNPRADLLTALVQARDAHGTGLTDGEIRDEAWGYIAQGAPGHALAWAWWLLSQHPDVEESFHEELARVLAGRTPTFADMPSLALTRAVFLEAMRLYPPVWGIERVALERYDLEGTAIPAGAYVFISPWVTQRDERFWPEPASFGPSRWTEGRLPDKLDFAYLPFGAGQRLCIARELVTMIGTLVLAEVGQRWRPRPVRPLELEVFPFLRPRGGLQVRLERRDR